MTTLIELIFSPVGVWVISALIGSYVTVRQSVSAWHDLADLGAIQNGRRRLARSNIEDEVSRAVILISWLVMGLLYLAAGQEPRHSVVGWVIVGGNVILTVNSIRRAHVRTYIRNLGRRDQAEDRKFGEQRRELEATHNEERAT